MARADRAIRDARRRRELEEQQAAARQASDRRNTDARLRNEAAALIPRALTSLGARDYPDAIELRVHLWELRGGYLGPRVGRAAWPVANATFWDRDGYITHTAYLLGNGKFFVDWLGQGPKGLKDLKGDTLAQVVQSLQRLAGDR
jgi:hypothetical protein